MSRLFHRQAARIGLMLVALLALQLAGCGSAEERAQRYYESGTKLLAAHENYKAAVEFRNALKLKKDLLPAWRGLAEAEEATNNTRELPSVLRNILDLDPKDVSTRVKLARLLLISGSVEQARKLIDDSSEADTHNAKLLAVKALVYYRLKERDAAINAAQDALKIEPDNVEALIVLAADRSANNDPQGALQILSGDSKTLESDLGVQLFKLKIYDQLKDYQKLESLLKELAGRYPQNFAFRNQLINLYMTQHRPDDAERELRAVVASDPSNSQAGLNLIRFLYSVKGPAAARQELVARIDAGGDVFPYQLALAEFDFDQGKAGQSFILLQKLANSESSTEAEKAKVMAAELNFRQKNTDVAEKIVDEVIAKDERNVEALKLRATIRLNRNQVDAAISDLRGALNDDPRSTDLMQLLAVAYERLGSIDLADKQFADAMKSSNFNPNVGLDYVAFLQRRNSSEQAYNVLIELANRTPNNVRVLSALAEMKLARQDWTGAQEIAELIRRIGNAGEVSNLISGAALFGEHKYDASIAAFQNAVAAAPTAPAPMADLVKVLVGAKQTDKAIAFLQASLKDNPNNAEAYVLLGNIQISNNAPDQAEKNFKAAIANQPKSYFGYQALVSLYLGQNKLDAAFDVVQAGLKEQPDSAELHLMLAAILEAKQDFDGAISENEYLLKQQPGSLVIINNLASLLADHRTDKASLDRAQGLALALRNSQVAQFKDTLGWVYYRQGDFKASVPLLEEAAASLPGSALVHYHLGMSYLGIGQPAKASDQFKDALTKSPKGDLEAKIREELKKVAAQ